MSLDLPLTDDLAIRDDDLLARISQSTSFSREFVYRQCVEEQKRRDAIAVMPRDTRRRTALGHQLAVSKAKRDDLRHLHSVLAICALPYTKLPLATREWNRSQGKMRLSVTAGKLMSPRTGEWEEQPLPYGSRARLLLIHTCSEALRQKSPTIEIEDSLTGFIRGMGFAVTGGKNGTLNSFKQQVNALAACNMRIGVWDGDHAKTINTSPFSQIEVWFPTSPDQKMLWPSTVTFSRDFYDTLTKHALPMNVHAVRAFAGSPRKLDLLFWLGYRLNSLSKPVTISWEALKEQFGSGYARERRFRSDLAEEITHIKEVFPKLPVKVTEEGFVISPGTSEVLSIPTMTRK